MKQCPSCGKSVNDHNRFCKYCGASITLPITGSSPPPSYSVPAALVNDRERSNLVIAVVVILVAAVILAAAISASLINQSANVNSTDNTDYTNTDDSDTDDSGGSNTVTPTPTTSTTNPTGTPGVTTTPTASQYYHKCKYNYYVEYTDKLYNGYSSDLSWDYPDNTNYIYAIVTLKIENNGDLDVSTNSLYWNYNLNGVEYHSSSKTYSSLMEYQLVTISKGGSATQQIVYEVPNSKVGASLVPDDTIASYKYTDYVYLDRSVVVPVSTGIAAPMLYSSYDGVTIIGSSTNIPVSWNNVPNAGYYEIRTTDVADFSHVDDTVFGTGTDTTVYASLIFPIGQSSGTVYIQVRAYDGWGRAVSDWSNTVTVTIQSRY